MRADISEGVQQSKIATARNAKDESEIDESQLNAGLLTYPVLQAADILAYRCGAVGLVSPRKSLTIDTVRLTYRSATTRRSTSSFAVT